ncbi:MAG: cytochrome c biogenesis protein ResB, partial [Acidobacteriota bacterium]|nr:cytochrome c biogenesis protein ResB [Acidobacteriota bacterium]
LTLFLGHFVALQTGFDADVGFQPGQTTSEIELIEFDLDKQNRFAAALPFSITCTDIRQKLIDPNGPIEVFNTLDWVTSIRIDDPDYGVTEADVALNRPFSYRGYRFFQAQTVPIGNARSVTLALTPEADGSAPTELTIPRTGSQTLKDGTAIKYEEFLPDFTFNAEGQPDTRSGDYNNPVAVLNVTPPNGQPVRVFAFAGNVSDDMPVGAAKAGYKWKLKNFEKSPRAHILSIKYDPYNGAFIAWYFGGIGLIGALVFVFFFSHRRVWASIEKTENGIAVDLGGDCNRNQQGFEERFEKLVSELTNDQRTGPEDGE